MKIQTIVCGAIGASIIGMATAATAQEFRLNWGHYLPNSPFVKAEQDFAKAVEERTDGRVEFNTVYSGGLGAGNELLTLVSRGAIDLGAIVPGYFADDLLFSKALQIPFIFESSTEAIEVANYSYENLPAFANELSDLNVRRLFHQPLGEYYTVGPSDDCKTMEGLKGKKIRTFGSDIPKMMTAVGAVPLSMGSGDQYEALERGTLDYGFVNLGNIEAYRLYEPGPNMCGHSLAMVGHMIVINEDRWQSLPEDIRTIILEEAKIAGDKYLEEVNANEKAAGERMAAEGANIVDITDTYLDDWKAATPDLLQQWVEELTAAGKGEAAAEVAAKWRELTAD
ncbi:MAG: TRAP transporter substrate-binding protein DctP [Roseovarius sp.]|nr:TRAP transporter substrate-binding protein DctP [Roseovarius sp.]